MTIRTEVTDEWQTVLDGFTPEEQTLLLDEAEHLANTMKYKNEQVRISTNGALEVLFAIGCAYNKIGQTHAPSGPLPSGHGRSAPTGKGNRHE